MLKEATLVTMLVSGGVYVGEVKITNERPVSKIETCQLPNRCERPVEAFQPCVWPRTCSN